VPLVSSCNSRTFRHLAAMATAVIALAHARSTRAEEWVYPESLSQAIRMEADNALPRTALYDTPSLIGTRPGGLLRQDAVNGYELPTGATAVRILYHSQNAVGADVATSALVLVPAGAPPVGGWPVIAWAHGTSGVARMCAPSLQKNVAYGEEGLMPMVRAGFAVVATDYHGLGTEGPHQYLNKVAHGHDVIYSVKAAQAAVPSLGHRWVVVGHSQGGLAAWSVAEMQATAKDPDYLGAISVAGGTNLALLHGLTTSVDSSTAVYLLYIASGIHAVEPTFKPSDMLASPGRKRYRNAVTKGCFNYGYATFLDVKGSVPTLRKGWDRSAAVQRFFEGTAAGTAPIGGPMFVIAGEADQTVPLALVKHTVDLACGRGTSVYYKSYPGLDHDPTMDQTTPEQLAWIRDRFAGKPAPENCATPTP
jgi:pimeloyl-ACP methyl ester carboxylesterase